MGLLTLFIKTKTSGVDPAAFESFYRATLKPLTRHLEALDMKNKIEIEDVLQNTYLEAYRNFHTIKDEQAALGWLLTIGRRQFYLYLAQRIRHRKIFAENSIAVGEFYLNHIDTQHQEPDERIHKASLCASVLRGIDAEADESKKLALQRYFLEDAKLKDIALETDTNLSTLTTWISRFRLKMQPLLLEAEDRAAAEPSKDSPALSSTSILIAAKEVCP